MSNKINGKECYLSLSDGTDDRGYVYDFETLKALNEHLLMLDREADQETVVLHGIKTDAYYLPPTLGDTNAFIIAYDQLDRSKAEVFAFDGKNINELADKIQELVEDGTVHNPLVGIDDISIFFGYDVELGFAVNKNEIEPGTAREILKGLMNCDEC